MHQRNEFSFFWRLCESAEVATAEPEHKTNDTTILRILLRTRPRSGIIRGGAEVVVVEVAMLMRKGTTAMSNERMLVSADVV